MSHHTRRLSSCAVALIACLGCGEQPEAATLQSDAAFYVPENSDAGPSGHDAHVTTPTPPLLGPDAGQPMPPLICQRGRASAQQVVMIGDSFFHITEIPQRLWQRAREAGSLGVDETYRHYFLSGAMMGATGGLVTQIPLQWDQAMAENTDVTFVVMNGGGNDVLIADRSCLLQAPPNNTACAATIDTAVNTASELFAKMGEAGVEHIVYAFYPHMPEFGLFQGTAPAINQTIDYAETLARRACEASVSPPCTFVSTIAAFEGHPEYLNPGDVHASPAGSQVAADLIWQAMVDQCVAQ